jgi:hypothetical protein
MHQADRNNRSPYNALSFILPALLLLAVMVITKDANSTRTSFDANRWSESADRTCQIAIDALHRSDTTREDSIFIALKVAAEDPVFDVADIPSDQIHPVGLATAMRDYVRPAKSYLEVDRSRRKPNTYDAVKLARAAIAVQANIYGVVPKCFELANMS